MVDPITDDSISHAWVSGWSGNRDLDRASGRPTLNLRCKSSSRYEDFFLDTNRTFINRGDPIPFILRVDQNDQLRGDFSPSTEGDGGFLETGAEKVLSALIPQLRDGTTLRVRMTDFRGTNHDFEFSLTGFTSAVQGLTCFSAFLHPQAQADTAIVGPEAEEQEGLSQTPTYTPYTDPPELKNREEITTALAREYPPLLRDAGIEGTAEVWFFIDATGGVKNIQIKKSSGHKPLDDAALRVAEVIRFTPARNRDENVPVWIALPIIFSTR